MDLRTTTVLKFAPDDLQTIEFSVPYWEAISRPPSNEGFVRHKVPRAKSRMPKDFKVPYGEHAKPLLERGLKSFVLLGARDIQQNLFRPGFHADRNPKWLGRIDEPWHTESYWGLVRYRDGRVDIGRVRFRAVGDASTPNTVEIQRGAQWEADKDIEFVVTGLPLVWDNRLVPLSMQAAVSYDLRHIYRLSRWEDRDDLPLRPAETRAHGALMNALMSHLDEPPETRARILEDIATDAQLKVEEHFHISSLGIDSAGNLIWIAAHGSLADIGRLLMGEGANRAIMLDEGGSVGAAFWSSRSSGPTYVGTGSYFRPRAHSLLGIVLKRDFYEPPFRDHPDFNLTGITTGAGRRDCGMVDDVERELESLAGGTCEVVYLDPGGPRRDRLLLPPADASHEVCEQFWNFGAVTVMNHAVLWGSSQVFLDAGVAFVSGVNAVFKRRFDRVDPGTGMESGSVTDYLGFFNGIPFVIEKLTEQARHRLDTHVRQSDQRGLAISGLGIGLDIGRTKVKLLIWKDGKVIYKCAFDSRPGGPKPTSDALLNAITDHVEDACRETGVNFCDVGAIGVTWPGATKGELIDGTSNQLRNLCDLCRADGRLDIAKVEAFRPLAKLVAQRLEKRLGRRVPTFLINDGNADALYLASQAGLREAIVIKPGGSIAGGYVDAAGRCDFLTEFGRFCLDLDLRAPGNPFTKITGVARELVSTVALARMLVESGHERFTEMNWQELDANAGEIASEILADEGDDAVRRIVRTALTRVGENLAHLVRALCRHLSAKHVVVSGGLVSKRSRAADVLLAAARRDLATRLPQREIHLIESDEGLSNAEQFVGAIAATRYALSRI